jgi:hypothetical protein
MHEHCHNHTHPEVIQKRDVKKLGIIAAINAGLMLFALGASRVTGVPAFDAEAAHDTNDTIVAASRAVSAHKSLEQKKWYGAFRKTSYATIIGFGAYAAVRSGVDLFSVAPRLKRVQDSVLELVGSGVVAGGNQAAYSIAKTLESPSLTNEDALAHANNDRNTALMLAGGIAVGAVVPYVSELTSVVAGGYTVLHMGRHMLK